MDSGQRTEVEAARDLFITRTVAIFLDETREEIQKLFLPLRKRHAPPSY
jgi:hypothetical protein